MSGGEVERISSDRDALMQAVTIVEGRLAASEAGRDVAGLLARSAKEVDGDFESADWGGRFAVLGPAAAMARALLELRRSLRTLEMQARRAATSEAEIAGRVTADQLKKY